MYNVIIETANKIIDKQGECYVGFFLTNCSDLCQLNGDV